MKVGIQDFGKDHWSLLAYVECRAVDHRGELERDKLRCNRANHPLLIGALLDLAAFQWTPSCGTRLKGYATDMSRRLDAHDDWDCLQDLEDAELVEVVSLINGIVKVTPKGWKVASLLRLHKANGGQFADFDFKEADLEKPV